MLNKILLSNIQLFEKKDPHIVYFIHIIKKLGTCLKFSIEKSNGKSLIEWRVL